MSLFFSVLFLAGALLFVAGLGGIFLPPLGDKDDITSISSKGARYVVPGVILLVISVLGFSSVS